VKVLPWGDRQPVEGVLQVRVTDLGWADLETDYQLHQEGKLNLRKLITAQKHHGHWRSLYATPQRRKGAKPTPGDDVYALGLLWYRAVMGNWELPPPTGLDWVNRAIDRGLTPPIAESSAAAWFWKKPEDL